MHGLSDPNGFSPSNYFEVDGLKQIEAAWTMFLGREVSLEYEYVNHTTRSPGSWEYVVGDSDDVPEAAELLIGKGRGFWDPKALSEAVSIHTMRYVLNERRSQLMGVPYVSSALRLPVQVVQMRNALHFRNVIERVFHPIAPSPPIGVLGPLIDHFRLPDAAGIAFSHASTRSNILGCAIDLRLHLDTFREALTDLRGEGASDESIVQTLRKTLRGHEFARTIDGTLAKVSAVATSTGADLGTALLVAKLAGPLKLAERATRFMESLDIRTYGYCRSFTIW